MDQHCSPFKIQTAQELSERDKQRRIQFCSQFLDVVRKSPDVVTALQMSDEAHLHLSGYVNKQNVQYRAPRSPPDLHQRPLHSLKVTAPWAVHSCGIMCPSLRIMREVMSLPTPGGMKLCWNISYLTCCITVTYQHAFNKMGPLLTPHE